MLDKMFVILGMMFISCTIATFSWAFIESRDYDTKNADNKKIFILAVIFFIGISYSVMRNKARDNIIKDIISSSSSVEEIKETLTEKEIILFY